MEFIFRYFQTILDHSPAPVISAVILGIMTALSPCPLATNITAIGYISKNIVRKRQVLVSGLLYTTGRAISYTSLGILFYAGASMFRIANVLQGNGEKILGPLLIILGVLMLGIIPIHLPGILNFSPAADNAKGKWAPLFLGILFALAFCPYSGVLFFGMLIPLTIASSNGLYLPFVFAIATGIPVIIIAWLIAYGVSSIGSFYSKVQTFEQWFRYLVAVIFIAAGIYYCMVFLIR